MAILHCLSAAIQSDTYETAIEADRQTDKRNGDKESRMTFVFFWSRQYAISAKNSQKYANFITDLYPENVYSNSVNNE